jgi:hypothetical protein
VRDAVDAAASRAVASPGGFAYLPDTVLKSFSFRECRERSICSGGGKMMVPLADNRLIP